MSMVRGRYDDASVAIERHVLEYPEGRLIEEREALSILLQLSVGEADAARTHFGNFRHRYPGSIFIPSIEQRLDKAKQPSNAAPSEEQPSAK
jgi:TolA-binding protein